MFFTATIEVAQTRENARLLLKVAFTILQVAVPCGVGESPCVYLALGSF